jgi:DNA-binding NarL/FixJ family response regulator
MAGLRETGSVSMPIRVLIVDDHPFVRMSVQLLLDATEDICVVGECADGSEVVTAFAKFAPDVVLMDAKMPKMNGLDAARELLAVEPQARVLMLTGTLDSSYTAELVSMGAVGLILKGDDPSKLPDHVRAVADGGTVWSRSVIV